MVDNPSNVERLFRERATVAHEEESHVLCRLPHEARRDFAQRVLERATALKETHFVRLSFFGAESTEFSDHVLRQLRLDRSKQRAPSSCRNVTEHVTEPLSG